MLMLLENMIFMLRKIDIIAAKKNLSFNWKHQYYLMIFKI